MSLYYQTVTKLVSCAVEIIPPKIFLCVTFCNLEVLL